MLQTALVAARDRRRLQQIGTVLVRFGLDDFVQRSGLRGLRGLPGSVEWLRWELVTSGLACRPRDESELHRDSATDAHSG